MRDALGGDSLCRRERRKLESQGWHSANALVLPPLSHLRNTRLVLRPLCPLVKLATLRWRCNVQQLDLIHSRKRPVLRSSSLGDLDRRPSIDGDREMTSEVTPNETSPRETSASQAALASCLSRPPGGLAPSLFVSYLCVSALQKDTPFGPPSANAARRVLSRAPRGRGILWRLLPGADSKKRNLRPKVKHCTTIMLVRPNAWQCLSRGPRFLFFVGRWCWWLAPGAGQPRLHRL